MRFFFSFFGTCMILQTGKILRLFITFKFITFNSFSYLFEISTKYDSFDVTIGIKVQFFRVSVTIEPGRSLLQFLTTKCLTMS